MIWCSIRLHRPWGTPRAAEKLSALNNDYYPISCLITDAHDTWTRNKKNGMKTETGIIKLQLTVTLTRMSTLLWRIYSIYSHDTQSSLNLSPWPRGGKLERHVQNLQRYELMKEKFDFTDFLCAPFKNHVSIADWLFSVERQDKWTTNCEKERSWHNLGTIQARLNDWGKRYISIRAVSIAAEIEPCTSRTTFRNLVAWVNLLAYSVLPCRPLGEDTTGSMKCRYGKVIPLLN